MFTDTQHWSFWQERCLISSQESSCFVERLYHSVHTLFLASTITCNITSLSSQNHELFLSRLVHLHRQISCFCKEIFVPNQRVLGLALQHLWLIGVDHKVMKKAKNGAVFQTREEVEEEDHARWELKIVSRHCSHRTIIFHNCIIIKWSWKGMLRNKLELLSAGGLIMKTNWL